MTLHRLMRETDASYLDALLKVPPPAARGGGGGSPRAPRAGAAPPSRLAIDGWVDTATIEGRFEFSEYVRALARYLDEVLAAHAATGWAPTRADDAAGGFGALAPAPLLDALPRLHALLLRASDCAPAGAASADPVVQASLLAVARESMKAYRAASEATINLADRFFDMDAAAAARALVEYRAAGLATARLQAFYRACEALPGLRGAMQFPLLQAPPADFVAQMEAYAAGAPRVIDGAEVSAAPAGAAPLRRGRLAAPGGASAPAPAIAPFAAPASPAAGGPDLLGDLMAGPAAAPVAAPAAPAAPAAVDPFSASDEPMAVSTPTPAPAPFAPPSHARSANPFDSEPAFAPAAPALSAPPATPAVRPPASAAAAASPSDGTWGAPAASAPAAPDRAADPFAALVSAGLGGLTLGPGAPKQSPLRAMAPPPGRPMSAGRAGGGGGTPTSGPQGGGGF